MRNATDMVITNGSIFLRLSPLSNLLSLLVRRKLRVTIVTLVPMLDRKRKCSISEIAR